MHNIPLFSSLHLFPISTHHNMPHIPLLHDCIFSKIFNNIIARFVPELSLNNKICLCSLISYSPFNYTSLRILYFLGIRNQILSLKLNSTQLHKVLPWEWACNFCSLFRFGFVFFFPIHISTSWDKSALTTQCATIQSYLFATR